MSARPGALILMLALTGAADAQDPPPLMGVALRLSDYGIEDVSQIVRGRVSVVHDPAGLRLAPYFLRTEPAGEIPAGPELGPLAGVTTAGGDRPLRALWVWNTDEILSDPVERGTFLDFIERQGISRIFLHLPPAEGEEPSAGYVPFDGTALGPLLSQLRERGALTYGLDGDPYYVLPENHAGVLRTVERLAEHNRRSPPAQRFHGVRYDIEPYLIPGFQGPDRARILDDWVRLLARVSEVAAAGGLAFGVDIPFWLDGPDEETGRPFEAGAGAERGLVIDHVMEHVDDVGIMAYRTTATGPDGVVTHAWGELSRASGAGVGVFVGVETTRLHDEHLFTFRGAGRSGLPTAADVPWVVLEERDGAPARIWYAEGGAALDSLTAETAEARSLTYWFAGNPILLAGDRLSFHGLGADAMRDVTDELLAELSGRRGFLGLAFHDYRGLRELLGSR